MYTAFLLLVTCHILYVGRLIVIDSLLCDVLCKKGNPPDKKKLTWQEASQRYVTFFML